MTESCIYNSYNQGEVYGHYTDATSTTVKVNVGGICGSTYLNSSTPAIYIKNCYNAGQVIGDGNNCRAGGFIGLYNATNVLDNVYYLSECAGNGTFGIGNDGTTSDSTAITAQSESKLQGLASTLNSYITSSSFTGWASWASVENGYPALSF